MMTRDLLVRGGVDAQGRRFDVLMAGSRVAAVGSALSAPADVEVLDAERLTVSAGLIDVQVNGVAGIDITSEPERLWDVARELARYGVTAFLPTVVTSAPEARHRALEALRVGRPSGTKAGAIPLGLHFEGPMLAPEAKGAHPEHWLVPPVPQVIEGWSRERGTRMATIAPELPGALDVIKELVRRGVVVSVGHTRARTEDVQAAVAAGASCVTHLFNAMPPLSHREPGPVGVVLGGDELVAAVIVDGHHVDPLAVRVAWRTLGPDRFLAVSDSTAALGLPGHAAVLGDQHVLVADGAVRLHDGTLAGSARALVHCVEHLHRMTGCSLADALATATTTPARLLEEAGRGRLAVGCRGDLILLDQGSLRPIATVVGGELVYDERVEGVARTGQL